MGIQIFLTQLFLIGVNMLKQRFTYLVLLILGLGFHSAMAQQYTTLPPLIGNKSCKHNDTKNNGTVDIYIWKSPGKKRVLKHLSYRIYNSNFKVVDYGTIWANGRMCIKPGLTALFDVITANSANLKRSSFTIRGLAGKHERVEVDWRANHPIVRKYTP